MVSSRRFPVLLVSSASEEFGDLSQILHDEVGCECHYAFSVSQALSHVTSTNYPVLLTSPRIGNRSWCELLANRGAMETSPEVIVLLNEHDPNKWADAVSSGAFDALARPFDGDLISYCINSAWRRFERRREIIEARRHATDFLFSPAGQERFQA
jgi:DNA-binding NtrC family response regulator